MIVAGIIVLLIIGVMIYNWLFLVPYFNKLSNDKKRSRNMNINMVLSGHISRTTNWILEHIGLMFIAIWLFITSVCVSICCVIFLKFKDVKMVWVEYIEYLKTQYK